MRRSDCALICAEKPPFEQRRNEMRKSQFHGGEYFPLIPQARKASIPRPAVCPDHASWFDHCLDKAPKALCRSIRHMLEANPSNSLRRFVFNADDDESFPFCSSATLTAFLTSTDISFAYLNAPRESVSSRSHHSPSKFVQPLPGCLIAAWLNDSSKAKSVSTVFLGGNVPHRAKPQTQGLAGAMKNRAGRYGSLDPTLLATPKPPVRPPRFIRSALRAHKPIRPTQSRQVFQASSLGRKPLLKLRQRPGIVFHDQTLHFVVTGVNPIPPYRKFPISTHSSQTFHLDGVQQGWRLTFTRTTSSSLW